MKRALIFKYCDLALLLLSISIGILGAIFPHRKEILDAILFFYNVSGWYIIFSTVVNRIFLKKLSRSALRTPFEITVIVFLFFYFISWYTAAAHIDTHNSGILWLFVIFSFFGIPVLVFLYIIMTIEEVFKLKRADTTVT